ncbi:hypothetical protein B0H16DRAFT_1727268 [Mycena metata]|uniref:F-box domain-containing protein n=1 Tax=Mycena metata TaxID=1033252 RepID=A0AAD7IJ24_9AGAR|nr:hypothetical protein B0H16DRAFT_1727268 [Mycena metata]
MLSHSLASSDLNGSRAPPEVMQLMFRITLPPYFFDPHCFCDLRGALALVCKYWAAVILDDSALWRLLYYYDQRFMPCHLPPQRFTGIKVH